MKNTYYEKLQLYTGDKHTLVAHKWSVSEPKAVMFYFHGMQSHAGWLTETADFMCQNKIDLCCLDRRGSGESGGKLYDKEQVFSDYKLLIDSVCASYKSVVPRIFLGQSLGASILTSFLLQENVSCSGLIYCAPALGQFRVKNSKSQLDALRKTTCRNQSLVTLKDEDYTSMPRYLDFLRGDVLMRRHISAADRRIFLEIEDSYFNGDKLPSNFPIALALPKSDNIINLAQSRKTLDRISGRRFESKTFNTGDHYLEFSSIRNEYLTWVTASISSMIGGA